jgi:predicted metalloprotease with PDZ domain
VVVTNVLRGSSGYRSGLSPDDELVAIDGVRLGPAGVDVGLAPYHPGDTVSLLVARRDELRRLVVTVERAPENRWTLERRPDASAEQAERLAAWLGPRQGARR